MKIYKAELIMFLSLEKEDEYESKFTFELESKEYEKDEKHNRYYRGEGWVGYSIPIDMEVEPTSFGLYKVVQGFEKELSKEELEDLKREMTLKIIKQLNRDKEDYSRRYDNKIQILNKILSE